MRRLFPVLLILLFPLFALLAQEPGITKSSFPFPLTPVLDAAGLTANEQGKSTGDFWQPDWPLDLPPDAFKVQNGTIIRAAVEGNGYSLKLRYDPEGRVGEFPYLLNGSMAQVSLVYRSALTVHELTLALLSGELSCSFEFLEYDDAYPSMVRVSCGEAWYFIALSKMGNVIMETWYDEEGIALGAYAFSLTEIGAASRISAFRDYGNNGADMEFFYDSRNLLTESSGFNGVFKVLYFREDLPRYWERRPLNAGETRESVGKFSLQWDEKDFLVSITAENGNLPDDAAECRYEYTLDGRGNWIERREIRMLHRFGLLVPSPGTTFRRILEYN